MEDQNENLIQRLRDTYEQHQIDEAEEVRK